MTKWVKKPVVVDAVQFKGFNNIGQAVFSQKPEWLSEQFGKTVLFFGEVNTLEIETLEGKMVADINDYIIKGVKGELYPCKPEIFHLTYESYSYSSQRGV